MSTYDTQEASAATFGATTVTTAAATIANVAKRAAVLFLAVRNNAISGISGDCGGTSGSAITGTDSGTAQIYRSLMFAVIAPPTGSQTATMSWTGASDVGLAFAVYNDIDQTTPFINGTFANAASGAKSCTPSGTDADASFCGACSGGISGATQTVVSTPGASSAVSQTTRGVPGATHGWGDSGDAWVVSGVGTKTAPLPTIDTQPADAISWEGLTVQFSVSATASSGSLTYQWQVDTGGGFSNVSDGSGGTSSTYTTPTLSYTMNGYHYRCNVTDDNGTVATRSALLTVLMTSGPLLKA